MEAPAKPARPRVLIVDDEAVIRLLFRDLLKAECELLEAGTAEEALERLANGRFNLIITDKNLPGLSGMELAREARRHDPSVRVILMTGYPSLATAQQSLELGLLDYLVKPFDDIRVVREKVRAALASPPVAPANPTSRRIDVYEDNPAHARAIAEALTHLNVEPHLVLQALPGGPELPAAIVLSWDFSQARGVKGLELLRRIAPGVPFVVLAEHLTMDTAIESLRGGALACLPKLLNDSKAMGRELQRALKLPAFAALP